MLLMVIRGVRIRLNETPAFRYMSDPEDHGIDFTRKVCRHEYSLRDVCGARSAAFSPRSGQTA